MCHWGEPTWSTLLPADSESVVLVGPVDSTNHVLVTKECTVVSWTITEKVDYVEWASVATEIPGIDVGCH